MVETALLAPWIFFLFVGVLDFGFFAYSLIAVQNAARVAALGAGTGAAASADQSQACEYVRDELVRLPNFASFPAACDSLPLQVTIQPFTDTDGDPATRVSVTYQSIPMIPIPGLLMQQYTVTRTAETKVFGS